MRRVLQQAQRVEGDGHRLHRQPVGRRALARADDRVMIEHHQTNGIFTSDHLIEYGARRRLDIDNALSGELPQIFKPPLLAHEREDIADEADGAGAGIGVPRHLALPLGVEQRLVGFRRLVARHHGGVEAGREHEQQQGAPVAVLVLHLGWIIGLVRYGDGRDETLAAQGDIVGDAIEHIGLHVARLALVEQADGGGALVVARVFERDAGILFFESRLQRQHDLIDDKRGVPDGLALAPRGVDGRLIGRARPDACRQGDRQQRRASRAPDEHGFPPSFVAIRLGSTPPVSKRQNRQVR